MPENKKTDTTVNPIRVQIKWRYFCPHCTGRAMFAANPLEFSNITCLNCKKRIEYDPNNWFEITDPEELAKVNK